MNKEKISPHGMATLMNAAACIVGARHRTLQTKDQCARSVRVAKSLTPRQQKKAPTPKGRQQLSVWTHARSFHGRRLVLFVHGKAKVAIAFIIKIESARERAAAPVAPIANGLAHCTSLVSWKPDCDLGAFP